MNIAHELDATRARRDALGVVVDKDAYDQAIKHPDVEWMAFLDAFAAFGSGRPVRGERFYTRSAGKGLIGLVVAVPKHFHHSNRVEWDQIVVATRPIGGVK